MKISIERVLVPYWGFLYLICAIYLLISERKSSRPLLGVLISNQNGTDYQQIEWGLVPYWGFLYLIREDDLVNVKDKSSRPLLGVLISNHSINRIRTEVEGSRPLLGVLISNLCKKIKSKN